MAKKPGRASIDEQIRIMNRPLEGFKYGIVAMASIAFSFALLAQAQDPQVSQSTFEIANTMIYQTDAYVGMALITVGIGAICASLMLYNIVQYLNNRYKLP